MDPGPRFGRLRVFKMPHPLVCPRPLAGAPPPAGAQRRSEPGPESSKFPRSLVVSVPVAARRSAANAPQRVAARWRRGALDALRRAARGTETTREWGNWHDKGRKRRVP